MAYNAVVVDGGGNEVNNNSSMEFKEKRKWKFCIEKYYLL
jgi:hypothetical protein